MTFAWLRFSNYPFPSKLLCTGSSVATPRENGHGPAAAVLFAAAIIPRVTVQGTLKREGRSALP